MKHVEKYFFLCRGHRFLKHIVYSVNTSPIEVGLRAFAERWWGGQVR